MTGHRKTKRAQPLGDDCDPRYCTVAYIEIRLSNASRRRMTDPYNPTRWRSITKRKNPLIPDSKIGRGRFRHH